MTAWTCQPASAFARPSDERSGRWPREAGVLCCAARCLGALLTRSWLRFYHRLEIVGRETLPRGGESFVMVANHASHLDALCLLSALPLAALHRAHPAAAADYFFLTRPRTALSSVLFNALPFHRGRKARQSLRACRRVLARPGHVLILFPEGTRSPDGRVHDFRPGVGALVAGTNTAVVPCRLDGTFHALPRGRWFPRPGKVRLTIGPPRRYAGLPGDRRSHAFIAADLRRAVVRLGEDPAGEFWPQGDPACLASEVPASPAQGAYIR